MHDTTDTTEPAGIIVRLARADLPFTSRREAATTAEVPADNRQEGLQSRQVSDFLVQFCNRKARGFW